MTHLGTHSEYTEQKAGVKLTNGLNMETGAGGG